MSSIRPLATITVLALVGVMLYMKINETEPPLPEGVEDWSVGAEIDFDMGDGDSMGAPQFSAAPTIEPSLADQAPAFTPSAPVATAPGTPAPAFDPNMGAAPAPAFAAAPPSTPPATTVAEAPSFEPTVEADTTAPTIPDLPPLPALPPATPSSAGTAASVTEVPPVEMPQDLALPSVPPSSSQPPMSAAPPVSTAPEIASPTTPPANAVQTQQSSLFSATRLAVQAALDRGELSQALLLLSDWYGDPSLSPSEVREVDTLLSQLAGSVIYSTEHRLEPPYMVQAGERLEAIAEKYQVPWQLLAKINGITSADQLQPGQELKVVRGPFSAVVDISGRKMTLMLDRRYAGQFSLDVDPAVTVEEGHWEVNQKLLTPGDANLAGGSPTTSSEQRSLMLSSAGGDATQVAILRGGASANPLTEPAGRVLRLSPTDAADVFDILSLGSRVVIRR